MAWRRTAGARFRRSAWLGACLIALAGAARASGVDEMSQLRNDPLIGGVRVSGADLGATPSWARVTRAIRDQAALEPRPLAAWIRWAKSLHVLSPLDRVRAINRLVNRKFAYDSDQRIWGRNDYWETPLDMVLKKRADCEGFAAFKAFLALIAGIDADSVALLAGIAPDTQEAHAVLLVVIDGVGYVLDNRGSDVTRTTDYGGLWVVYGADFDNAWIYPLALSGL